MLLVVTKDMQKSIFAFFKNNSKVLIGLAVVVFALLPFVVPEFAHAAIVNCGNEDGGSSANGCKFSDLFNGAITLINYLFSGAAVLAVGGVVWGGFLMVTSAGNSSKQSAGKTAVKNSVIGLVVVLLSFVMVRTVFTVLGYRGGASPLENPQDFIDSGPNLLQSGSFNPNTPPNTTPPNGTNPPPAPTGTAAQIAQKLLDEAGTGCFLNYHVGNQGLGDDGASARSNLQDTAAGRPAKRSSYGTAPGGTVALDARMLDALLAIHKAGHRSMCPVTAIAGSSHTNDSAHYDGKAFDIDKTTEASAILAICTQYGAKSAANEGNHLHCRWE